MLAVSTFPPEPLVVFLYNPFSGEILRSVMQTPRATSERLYVVYVNPLHGDLIIRAFRA